MKARPIDRAACLVTFGTLAAATISLGAGLPTVAASAFTTIAPEPRGCVKTYYDRATYGWLAVRNDCGAPIHVTMCPHVPPNGQLCGGMVLPTGGHDSTGSGPDEIERNGGFLWAYPCPDGYDALKPDGTQLTSSLSPLTYECLKE